MGEGRGSALRVLLAGLMVMFVMSEVEGKIYTVGDSQGWGFDIGSSGWANGKRFKAGDVLVFKYPKGDHNVAVVSKTNFASCNQGPAKPFDSGNDRVILKKGPNYFICSFPDHCEMDMKLAVNAA